MSYDDCIVHMIELIKNLFFRSYLKKILFVCKKTDTPKTFVFKHFWGNSACQLFVQIELFLNLINLGFNELLYTTCVKTDIFFVLWEFLLIL